MLVKPMPRPPPLRTAICVVPPKPEVVVSARRRALLTMMFPVKPASPVGM